MREFDGRLRLGFTGAGRTGKGTVGKRMAEKLGLTYLPSHISETGKMLRLQGYNDQTTDAERLEDFCRSQNISREVVGAALAPNHTGLKTSLRLRQLSEKITAYMAKCKG